MKRQEQDLYSNTILLTPIKHQIKFKQKHQSIFKQEKINLKYEYPIEKDTNNKVNMAYSHNKSTSVFPSISNPSSQKQGNAYVSNEQQVPPFGRLENPSEWLRYFEGRPIDSQSSSVKIPLKEVKIEQEQHALQTPLQELMIISKQKTKLFDIDPLSSEVIWDVVIQYEALMRQLDEQRDLITPAPFFFRNDNVESKLTKLLFFTPNHKNGRNICFDQQSSTCVPIYKCYGCLKTFQKCSALGGHLSKCPDKQHHVQSMQEYKQQIKQKKELQLKQKAQVTALDDILQYQFDKKNKEKIFLGQRQKQGFNSRKREKYINKKISYHLTKAAKSKLKRGKKKASKNKKKGIQKIKRNNQKK